MLQRRRDPGGEPAAGPRLAAEPAAERAALPAPSAYQIAGWALMGVARVGGLGLKLLAALLAGLLVYELVHAAAGWLARAGLSQTKGKLVALAAVAVVTVTALSLAGLGLSSLLTGKSESLAALLRKMADVIETASG